MLVLGGAVVAAFLHRMANPHRVAWAVTPDGVELCLIQRWNGMSDLFFTTTFAVRHPGTNWLTYYVHHEDSYWDRAAMDLDVDRRLARVSRSGEPVITYDWRRRSYSLRRGGYSAERSPWVMPPGWA